MRGGRLAVLMEFFDCNVSYGPSEVPPPSFSETPQALLDEMDFCGVQEALVRHAAQRDDSPLVGNELLAEEMGGYERLHGAWAVLPPQTGEQGGVDSFLDAMREHRIQALWAYPAEHRFLMTRTALGSLYEVMVEKRIPLFLSVTESCGGLSGWMLVEQVLAASAELTLVVTDHGSWGDDRLFRPLLESYGNLYVDTSRYELDGGLAALCRRYGPGRLLFGTGYPQMNMGGPLLTLASADISDSDREAVGGANLRRILGSVRL